MSAPTGVEPHRFFFLHLQKTAGTALWQRLREAFDHRHLYPGPEDGPPPISTLSVDHLLECWAARRDEIQVVTGHFPLCTTELLGTEFTTFTLLRDPIERTLSALRGYRENTPGMAEVTLEEIYEEPLRQLMLHNHMVKMLSLSTREMTEGAMTEVSFTQERLDRAKSALSTVDVIGVQTRFEEFCSVLSERFGWDLGLPRFANRSQPVEVNDTFRARIEADNAPDVELYAYGLELAQ